MIQIKLSEILGIKRLSQADLARMTGIRPSTINELYHELSERVTLAHLDLICDALECELGELLIRTVGEESTAKNTKAGHKKQK